MSVLWQPMEFLIIGGAAIGAYIIANPTHILKKTGYAFKCMLKGSRYKKQDYIELLSLLYQVSKLVKTKGALAIEKHVENPHESSLFEAFPSIHKDHHSLEFLCDYLRLWTLGTENPREVGDIIDEELSTHHHESHEIGHALTTLGDSFPALGIVAAVLGVIHTMGSISEPPEVLGHLIGGALVGTFFGILISYGFVSPMAASAQKVFDHESRYFTTIKAALVAHMQGYAPAVVVEFARKHITSDVRPTFLEVEEACSQLTPPS